MRVLATERLRPLLIMTTTALATACIAGGDPEQAASREWLASARPHQPDIELGQWAKWRTTVQPNTRAETTVVVTGEERGHYWLEVDQRSDQLGVSRFRMLARPATLRSPNPSILDLVVEEVSSPSVPEAVLIEAIGEVGSELIARFGQVHFDELATAPEPIQGPAGTFHGCFIRDVSERSDTAPLVRTWLHPEVPLSGIVRAQTTDGSLVQELVDFGF